MDDEEGILTEKIVKDILEDLKKTRKQAVDLRDVAKRNCKAGRLIVFDNALTEPHFLFQIRPRCLVGYYTKEDLFEFDQRVEDEGARTWVGALPPDVFLNRLGPRKRK